MSQVSPSVQPELAVNVHGTFADNDKEIERQPPAEFSTLRGTCCFSKKYSETSLDDRTTKYIHSVLSMFEVTGVSQCTARACGGCAWLV